MFLRRVALLIVVALVLAGCGAPSEADIQAAIQATTQAQATAQAEAVCGPEGLSAYADTIEELISRFEQQRQLVASTPRASLGEPLQRLLDIQTETRKIDAPECLKEYHSRLIAAMIVYQQAYQNFAAQGDDITTTAFLEVADESMTGVRAGLSDLRAGNIPPTATPLPTTAEPALTPTP